MIEHAGIVAVLIALAVAGGFGDSDAPASLSQAGAILSAR
jgi:hypothetical protein